jgi:Terpene cyclase DEP1
MAKDFIIMTLSYLYIVLCVLGTVLPYHFLVPFVLQNGLNIRLFIEQLFASPVSAFFGADVMVSSAVLWVFAYSENRKQPVRLWWLCILANLMVGVSLGLPLFLLLREIAREKRPLQS